MLGICVDAFAERRRDLWQEQAAGLDQVDSAVDVAVATAAAHLRSEAGELLRLINPFHTGPAMAAARTNPVSATRAEVAAIAGRPDRSNVAVAQDAWQEY